MQQILSIFNPENDLALANGDENYEPPRPVRKMKEDLSALPLWYRPESHYILAPSLPDTAWNREIEALFPVNSRFLLPGEVGEYPALHPQPWGWNPMLVKQLQRTGLHSPTLPSVSQLSHIRRLSHRVVAVCLLEKLQLNPFFCGRSALLTSQQEIREFAGKYAPIVLKAPYSGSGRGLFWGKGTYTEGMERWSNRILRQQGGVIGEPVFDKADDFAM
ncbi:MAG: hypothetical protein LUE93_10280 [Bacteroides sp.]|nr:hypothetical protein [Bacteroides sp.]